MVLVTSVALPGTTTQVGGVTAEQLAYVQSTVASQQNGYVVGNGANGGTPAAPANYGVEMKMVHSLTGPISPRVYKLLKTKTLAAGDQEDQIQFSDVQGVGDPITIEELNREELYRLVLVNFARLSVKQDWDGLLG